LGCDGGFHPGADPGADERFQFVGFFGFHPGHDAAGAFGAGAEVGHADEERFVGLFGAFGVVGGAVDGVIDEVGEGGFFLVHDFLGWWRGEPVQVGHGCRMG
jgi:hypothetical protein